MSDEELIEKVALIWIENGGDSEGLLYCWKSNFNIYSFRKYEYYHI
jgi:hypothetical protein